MGPSTLGKIGTALLPALLMGLLSCEDAGGPSSSGPPGILLISVDAIRADRLSVYGGEVEMPNLARLAGLGTLFEDAATPCPMSRPSATTLLTGLAPDQSGVISDTSDRLGNEVATLAGVFGGKGRETLGVVTTPFCSYSSGLGRGFDLFDGTEWILAGPERFFPRGRPDSDASERFAEWLPTLGKDQDFFAWVHLSRLHGRLFRFEGLEEALAAYDEQLASTDEAVGEILDALEAGGRLEGTAIVLVGTHGTLLGENGARGAAYWLRRETLEVPLIIKAPGFEAGGRSRARVGLTDVAATLASLGGVRLDGGAEGVDLTRDLEEVRERTRMAWTWAPEEEIAWPTLTAVEEAGDWITFSWDAVEAGGGPGLQKAISRPARPRVREIPGTLQSRLEAEGLMDRWEDSGPPEPDSATRDQLLTKIQLVRHPFTGGAEGAPQRRARRRLAKKLLEDHADNLAVIFMGIYWGLEGGRSPEATKLGEHGLSLYPTRPELLHWLAHVVLTGEEKSRGLLLVEAAFSVSGSDPSSDLLYDLACTRALNGDHDEALDRLEQAIEAGFRDFAHIESDQDLESIRAHPRYAAIMGSHGR